MKGHNLHSVVVVGYWPLLNAVDRQSVKLDPPPVSSTQSQLQIGLVSQSCESVFKSDVCRIMSDYVHTRSARHKVDNFKGQPDL